jgi:predicted transcriptional regulator of viral defense system
MKDFDEFLRVLLALEKPAFRTRAFAAALARSGKSTAYAWLALHRLGKKGKLARVRRGWWALPDALPEEVACAVSAPCYLSFHSALYVHGLTTQIPLRTQLAVARKPKKYGVAGAVVQEYRVPRKFFAGYAVNAGLPLASPEKAFADCLLLPRACPNVILVEVLASAGISEGVDVAAVRGYCGRNKRMLNRLKKLVKQAEREKQAEKEKEQNENEKN